MADYKKFLIAQIEGKTLQDIITGCDAIAAMLERNTLTRNAESPDKTGRYYYSVTDDDLIEFNKISDILTANTNLKTKNFDLVNENTELKQKIEEANIIINQLKEKIKDKLEIEKQLEEVKKLQEEKEKTEENIDEIKPEPEPKRPKRFKTY